MYHVLTDKVFELLPDWLDEIVRYCTSPGVVIPVLVLLVLIIYYLVGKKSTNAVGCMQLALT